MMMNMRSRKKIIILKALLVFCAAYNESHFAFSKNFEGGNIDSYDDCLKCIFPKTFKVAILKVAIRSDDQMVRWSFFSRAHFS